MVRSWKWGPVNSFPGESQPENYEVIRLRDGPYIVSVIEIGRLAIADLFDDHIVGGAPYGYPT